MLPENIIGPYEPTSSAESDTAVARIQCLRDLDQKLDHYREAGRQLCRHIAEKAWGESPQLHQEAIDRLNRRRHDWLWFAWKQHGLAVTLGIGEAAEAIIRVAVDLDAAMGRRFVQGATP